MKDDDKKINSNFETGANSNEINDLILFSDNTERLATLRDNIYKKGAQNNNLKFSDFTPLLKLAIIMYRNEFIKDFPIKDLDCSSHPAREDISFSFAD